MDYVKLPSFDKFGVNESTNKEIKDPYKYPTNKRPAIRRNTHEENIKAMREAYESYVNRPKMI